MKIEIKFDVEVKKPDYPYIGYFKTTENVEYIVLFTSKDTGTLLNKNKYSDAGYYGNNWGEVTFKPFQGSITLSN